MKISRDWLQTFFEKPLPDVSVLADALTFHAFEIDSVEAHEDDHILDVKVTPNRGHDALSHYGIAKELSAILKMPLSRNPLAAPVPLTPTTDLVSIRVENTALCSRYSAAYIKEVQVGPSPEWLQKRLVSIGQRSINNVVDAANFVMFNIGQPLHAFDAQKLVAKQGRYTIDVRAARAETITTLDNKSCVLSDTMLVIADGNSDAVLGVAGVKGGKLAEVNDTTTDLILEAANFNGPSLRKTARALNLRTDASQRFEQVLSPELTAHGMRAFIELVIKVAGGELVGCVDTYPITPENVQISITLEHINRVLGASLNTADVEDVFDRLMFGHTRNETEFTITAPIGRLDLVLPEDIIEEVGRIIGYEKIVPRELPPLSVAPQTNQNFASSEKVRETFVSLGYSEVYTSVFAEKGERGVSNKIGGDRPYLRASLLEGLSDALKKNAQNKELLGLTEVKLFEIGAVWKGGQEVVMVGVVTEKQAPSEKPLSLYLEEFSEYESLPLSKAVRYEPFSKYPYIVRDVALWTPKGTESEIIATLIRSHAGDLLIRLDPFDRFEKGDRVSYAFRLVFQSFDRTLQDEDANMRMNSVYDALKASGYEIR